MDLELRHLRCLVAIVDAGTFTDAAIELGISQAAVSRNLVAEATTGHTRLRIGHPWSAMGRHTREFQRRWAARYPDVELQLIRTNSATGGLAEGLCDMAELVRINCSSTSGYLA